jgi:hypothetical protein
MGAYDLLAPLRVQLLTTFFRSRNQRSLADGRTRFYSPMIPREELSGTQFLLTYPLVVPYSQSSSSENL